MLQVGEAEIEAKKQQADAKKEEVQAQKFKAALEFMSRDTSNMAEEQRALYKKRCAKLEAKYFG